MNDQARTAVLGWQQTVNAAWDQQQAVMSAAGAVEVPPPGPRGLTQSEIEIARAVFGDTLDPSRITVNESAIIAGDGKARALSDGSINFPPGTFAKAGTSPGARLDYEHWLVHELTHQWQYQHGARMTFLLPDAIAADYDYGGPAGLVEATNQGRAITDFNYEEQGDILADYYVLTQRDPNAPETKRDLPAYLPFVEDVKQDPPPPSFLEEVLLPLITGPLAP
jgi:hypothetical protein